MRQWWQCYVFHAIVTFWRINQFFVHCIKINFILVLSMKPSCIKNNFPLTILITDCVVYNGWDIEAACEVLGVAPPWSLCGIQKLFPPTSISLITLSMGVFPGWLVKKRFSTKDGLISLRAGSLSSRWPDLANWLLCCILSYSSSDARTLSCRLCTVVGSCNPGTSTDQGHKQ